MKIKIKSLFVSDIHLGCQENNAEAACRILDMYHYENLFIVGDAIDIKQMQKKWFWNEWSSELVHKVLNCKAKVIYIQGNHERGFFDGVPDLRNIHFCRQFIYKDNLIIHGDQFDTAIGNRKWLYNIGDIGYNASIRMNYFLNKIRKLLGYKNDIQLSKSLKKIVKNHINYLSDYYSVAVEYAKINKCNRVICGHVHQQERKQVGEIEYINCGDLRQDKHYLIEDLNEEIQLKEYHD